jgi:hypothetical protein
MSAPKINGVDANPKKGSSENPEKNGRDTAEGCRKRAAEDEQHAGSADTENGRLVLERSAASWTARSRMLERLGKGMEARRVAPRLTQTEVAEDAALANAQAARSGEDG